MSADFTLDGEAEPPSRLRRLVVPVLALAVGALLGFAVRSWVAIPSTVVVDGHPSTLHVYRVDPVGALSQPGHGEAVIFKQATISRLVTELNNLPTYATRGRPCDKSAVYVTLSFSYDNGEIPDKWLEAVGVAFAGAATVVQICRSQVSFELLEASNQPADFTLLALGQVPCSGVHYLSGNLI